MKGEWMALIPDEKHLTAEQPVGFCKGADPVSTGWWGRHTPFIPHLFLCDLRFILLNEQFPALQREALDVQTDFCLRLQCVKDRAVLIFLSYFIELHRKS